jgi:hypothetical protein
VAHKVHRSQSLPIREELEALAHRYRHAHNELERTARDSTARRKAEHRLHATRERFDQLLDEWVDDDALRARWREHLNAHEPEPDEPPAIEPVVFRGENDAGATAEVRRRDDELSVLVDGTLLERVAAENDFASRLPGLTFHVDGFDFHETFAAAPEAIRALAGFVESGGEPPWETPATSSRTD